jgi:hypothetical protein
MAAYAAQGQTIAALLEVGDHVRTGEHPDDFITVTAVHHRPSYVKLETMSFDRTPEILRVRSTDVVMILTFKVDEPIVLDDPEVTECLGKHGMCGNTETLEGGYCMFCREQGEGA